MNRPDTDIPEDGGPLTDRELLEGILDELGGIRIALVNVLRMQTIPPMVRDHVIVDEDGVITIPAPTHPPFDDAARDARRAKFQAAILKGDGQ
jgi:hypothetical protein